MQGIRSIPYDKSRRSQPVCFGQDTSRPYVESLVIKSNKEYREEWPPSTSSTVDSDCLFPLCRANRGGEILERVNLQYIFFLCQEKKSKFKRISFPLLSVDPVFHHVGSTSVSPVFLLIE